VRSGMVGQLSHLGPGQGPTKGISREQRDLSKSAAREARVFRSGSAKPHWAGAAGA
jgi:hypothetical protein